MSCVSDVLRGRYNRMLRESDEETAPVELSPDSTQEQLEMRGSDDVRSEVQPRMPPGDV